jgi:3-isopropylmalate/(R)-2-methylmalate dehydratase small subunit
MKALNIVRGQAVSLPESNIDTDIIYPARFLVVLTKTGLAEYAFHDRIAKDPDFPIHPGMDEPILIAGENFGSGSSREQAPWALADLGIRVIIAPSFGDIFHGNCFRNGLLPIRLSQDVVDQLHAAARAGIAMEVSLADRAIHLDGDDQPILFQVPEDGREALLNGWNETTRILQNNLSDITAFETTQRAQSPWLWVRG